MSLSALNDELAQVRTKKKEFLEQIERIVPWGVYSAARAARGRSIGRSLTEF